jgi:hypothetical protein
MGILHLLGTQSPTSWTSSPKSVAIPTAAVGQLKIQLPHRESNQWHSGFLQNASANYATACTVYNETGESWDRDVRLCRMKELLLLVYISAWRYITFLIYNFLLPTFILIHPPFSMSRRYKITPRPSLEVSLGWIYFLSLTSATLPWIFCKTSRIFIINSRLPSQEATQGSGIADISLTICVTFMSSAPICRVK